MKNNNYTTKKDLLDNMAKYITPNVVIGDPIITSFGTVIIPVSKLTLGFIEGVGEYGKIKVLSPNKSYPKSNAEGGVVSMKPFGFLVESKKGVKFVSLPETYMDKTIDAILNLVGDKNEKI